MEYKWGVFEHQKRDQLAGHVRKSQKPFVMSIDAIHATSS